jgi:hypothetical protein
LKKVDKDKLNYLLDIGDEDYLLEKVDEDVIIINNKKV